MKPARFGSSGPARKEDDSSESSSDEGDENDSKKRKRLSQDDNNSHATRWKEMFNRQVQRSPFMLISSVVSFPNPASFMHTG